MFKVRRLLPTARVYSDCDADCVTRAELVRNHNPRFQLARPLLHKRFRRFVYKDLSRPCSWLYNQHASAQAVAEAEELCFSSPCTARLSAQETQTIYTRVI